MAKHNSYFSHDDNAFSDFKIMCMRSEYGFEGYGFYWYLIEKMRASSDYCIPLNKKIFNVISLETRFTPEFVEKFINDCINEFELFKQDNESFYSSSLLTRMETMEKTKNQRSQAGKKSAEKRKSQREFNDRSTTVENSFNENSTNKIKEIKEINKTNKEKKDDVSFPDGNSIVNDDVMISERLNDTFEALWKIYPTQLNKRGKKNECLELFVSLNLDQQECNKILINTNKLKQTENWLKENGRFIPKLIDYIDNARWNDYIEETTNQFNRERLPMTLQEIEANLSKEDIEQLKENGRKAELEKQRLLNEHRY